MFHPPVLDVCQCLPAPFRERTDTRAARDLNETSNKTRRKRKKKKNEGEPKNNEKYRYKHYKSKTPPKKEDIDIIYLIERHHKIPGRY